MVDQVEPTKRIELEGGFAVEFDDAMATVKLYGRHGGTVDAEMSYEAFAYGLAFLAEECSFYGGRWKIKENM